MRSPNPSGVGRSDRRWASRSAGKENLVSFGYAPKEQGMGGRQGFQAAQFVILLLSPECGFFQSPWPTHDLIPAPPAASLPSHARVPQIAGWGWRSAHNRRHAAWPLSGSGSSLPALPECVRTLQAQLLPRRKRGLCALLKREKKMGRGSPKAWEHT